MSVVIFEKVMKNQLFSFLFLISFVFGISAQTQEARKIDEFGNTNCEGYLARMDGFLIELNNLPDSKGYVFVYAGKTLVSYNNKGKYIGDQNQYVLPYRNEAKSRIQAMKTRLRSKNLPNGQINFVESGFRENYTVEFWLVPKGVMLPKPTPTLTKMRYRKGAASDFCRGI